MIKTKWSHDCLIFIMWIPISGKTVFIFQHGQVFIWFSLVIMIMFLRIKELTTDTPYLAHGSEIWGGLNESWWRHQMETFSALLALCAGNSPVPVNSPHKGQWCRALMFSLICVWINDSVNNREAGDLRCHGGHYDVNVMSKFLLASFPVAAP